MGASELGKEISRRRRQERMTQQELSEGICSQAALSKIEKGDTVPALENLFHLSIRLNQPLDKWLLIMTEMGDAESLDEVTGELENLIQKREFLQVIMLTEQKLSAMKDSQRTWMKHYLEFIDSSARYHAKMTDWQNFIQQCKDMLPSQV